MAQTSNISISAFGKDHWALLAYCETRCVDHDGRLDKRQLRCNEHTHPMHAVNTETGWKGDYGTRLAGVYSSGRDGDKAAQIPWHDDWDCLDDLTAAGLIEIVSLANAIISITDRGLARAWGVREHKTTVGHFSNYYPQQPAEGG